MAWIVIILGATLIGLSLGLLGSGGSILTVPVLVYLLRHEDKAAIAESLAIVGGIALAGAIPYAWHRRIHWRSVVWFGVPGMAGTYLGAAIARYVPGAVQLGVFALVMLWAAWMMARSTNGPAPAGEASNHRAAWKIVADGLAVGVLTGFVGVGGGFLIVPALVLLGGLPMSAAVGTSLLIIAMKSGSGFVKYLEVLGALELRVDWLVVGSFILVGAVGTFIGGSFGRRLDQRVLRRVFAGFLVLMGIFILARETPRLIAEARPAPRVESAPAG